MKRYDVTIKYVTEEFYTPEGIYADSEEKASEIALLMFNETHTAKCKNPVVTNVAISKKKI